jgi:hypothetical protein
MEFACVEETVGPDVIDMANLWGSVSQQSARQRARHFICLTHVAADYNL